MARIQPRTQLIASLLLARSSLYPGIAGIVTAASAAVSGHTGPLRLRLA